MNIPRRVPVRIEYRKRDRTTSSLCYVLAEEDGLLVCAGTLDGDIPLGIVPIQVRDERSVTRLVDGVAIGGRGG